MTENEYQNMMGNIQVPDGLEERVLSAARQESAPPKRQQPWGKLAVCAACVLALVVGSVNLQPEEPDKGESVETLSLSLFTLKAYAAETGETYEQNANGGLALLTSTRILFPEEGFFTGCLFQIKGEGIETVSASIDCGGLYRTEVGAVDVEAAEAVLGAQFTESYDPSVCYGFWVPPEEIPSFWRKDPRRSSTMELIDTFDGGKLCVDITFSDGTTQNKIYTLSSGYLVMSQSDDGQTVLLPELATEEMQGAYGLYAASVEDSRWFSWPVEGVNTISLSNFYGFRAKPGGVGESFHAGIDIPAPTGTSVTAALDGMVKKTGFDPDRGNYLVLEHGNGLTTLYAQCQTLDAEQGDTVKAGELIATVGSTGKSTGPHLHFEVRQDGQAQNPVAYFNSTVRETLKMG